jgi:hypothetical protein
MLGFFFGRPLRAEGFLALLEQDEAAASASQS